MPVQRRPAREMTRQIGNVLMDRRDAVAAIELDERGVDLSQWSGGSTGAVTGNSRSGLSSRASDSCHLSDSPPSTTRC